MHTTGIIAEFNPLHNGHKYLIDEAKKQGLVICVLSGNFVQRGDTAIYEKSVRAEMALISGADIVLELPVCWSMSTAQNFALGGVSILNSIGCDTILFGSESGNIEILENCADIFTSLKYNEKVKEYMQAGITYANAREKAALYCGLKENILSSPNNNLGIEYIVAAKKIKSNINFKTVIRKDTKHDSESFSENFASASLIRKKILSRDFSFVSSFIPQNIYDFMKNQPVSDILRIENAILSVLRTKSINDLSSLPDISEGIENKLYSSIKLATGINELYNIIKVKRYTHSRIRRLVLSSFIGIDKSTFMKEPSYIRVLGFNKKGEKYIRDNISLSNLPVIMRSLEINNLNKFSKHIFNIECRATDLYGLSLNSPIPCGLEYTRKLIKTE